MKNSEESNKTFIILAMKTQKLRYALVKLIAPVIYKCYLLHKDFRPMIAFLNKSHNKNLVGVEIGVLYGENAETILKSLSIQKLYLVDPYLPYARSDCEQNILLDITIAQKRLSQYRNKIFVQKKSSEAVNDIPDDLDFVYIDGNHTYEHVKEDIELYYPKIKEGGVLGGHDFSSSFLGVCKAVMEFANKNNLKLQGGMFDWWIVKE